MKTYDIWDSEVAEAIFWYCDANYMEWIIENTENEISMINFAIDRISKFNEFCMKRYGFMITIDAP